jgi:Na+/H+-dicarboxylate symporter
MGVPIEPLVLLVAVETLPDIVRTTGNVAMDVATTATLARRSGFAPGEAMTEQDQLLQSAQAESPPPSPPSPNRKRKPA